MTVFGVGRAPGTRQRRGMRGRSSTPVPLTIHTTAAITTSSSRTSALAIGTLAASISQRSSSGQFLSVSHNRFCFSMSLLLTFPYSCSLDVDSFHGWFSVHISLSFTGRGAVHIFTTRLKDTRRFKIQNKSKCWRRSATRLWCKTA